MSKRREYIIHCNNQDNIEYTNCGLRDILRPIITVGGYIFSMLKDEAKCIKCKKKENSR